LSTIQKIFCKRKGINKGEPVHETPILEEKVLNRRKHTKRKRRGTNRNWNK